jgi:hypothetical protein
MTAPRLLLVPGLHDSGPTHWQSWLQRRHRNSLRVRQRDFTLPDLAAWSARIDETLASRPGERFVAVAHSFGCLALMAHLAQGADSPIRAALLVAPADPQKFGIADQLPAAPPGPALTLVYSLTDPWMRAASARRWALAWGAQAINLGDAGHINSEAGFGPLPLAQRWVEAALARWARELRPQRAAFAEWQFAH